ncbi:ribonuclease H-like domain-containing protein [Tanacetum coccineum]
MESLQVQVQVQDESILIEKVCQIYEQLSKLETLKPSKDVDNLFTQLVHACIPHSSINVATLPPNIQEIRFKLIRLCGEAEGLLEAHFSTILGSFKNPLHHLNIIPYYSNYLKLGHGTLYRYKARLVANESTHVAGIDVDETFSPVVKPGTIRTVLRMFLSQRKYAIVILERAHMVNCNPSQTPVDTESKLGVDGDPMTLYRSLAGSLQYLTVTRPNISYAMQHVCLYMHDPREPYFLALKRILWYVQGTLDHGL